MGVSIAPLPGGLCYHLFSVSHQSPLPMSYEALPEDEKL